MITLTISTLDGNVRETSLPSFNNLEEAKDWTEKNSNRLKDKEWFIFYEGGNVVHKATCLHGKGYHTLLKSGMPIKK
jgi:hypothetical protein